MSKIARAIAYFSFFLFLLLPALGQSSDQAVTFQLNPTHNAVNNADSLQLPLKVKWSVDLGATVSYPLIAGGKVFVIAGDINSNSLNLYAINVYGGTTIWGPVSIPRGYYWWAAAAYDNGKIFVVPGSVLNSLSGVMFAYDADTGKQLWSATLPGQYSFSSPPTALNGVVYTGGAGSGGTVYAVSESNGAILWSQSVENGDDSSPVVTANGVYVSYACPQSYRFNPTTGTQVWHYNGPCEGGGGDTPVLFNNSLYVRDSFINPYTYNGAILNAATGALTGYFNSAFAPVFLNATGYYTEPATLTAMNLKTGKAVWSAVPATGDTYSIAPIIVNSVVYVGTSQGNLLGYRASDGKKLVSISVGYPISGPYYSSAFTGLGAAAGKLIVPAGTHLVAYGH